VTRPLLNRAVGGGHVAEAFGSQRTMCQTKASYLVVCRFGDPMHPHCLVVSRADYTHNAARDGRRGSMEMTRFTLPMVQMLPGAVHAPVDRLKVLLPQAQARARIENDVCHCILDVSRVPGAWIELVRALPFPTLLVRIKRIGDFAASSPYWLCGRDTLLSSLNVHMGRPNVFDINPTPDGADPTIWDRTKVREALAAARYSPPKEEEAADGWVTEGTSQDDVAVAVGLALSYAVRTVPDPWYRGGAHVEKGEAWLRKADRG
jgi:hypothetical protein